jgi:hypothetical protein
LFHFWEFISDYFFILVFPDQLEEIYFHTWN